MFGFRKKKEVPQAKGPQLKRQVPGAKKRSKRHAGPYSPDQRRQAVEAYLQSGMTHEDFAKTWGTSTGSLSNWVKIYKEQGPKALDGASLRRDAKKRGRKGLPASVKTEILNVKRENPNAGNKGVRNLLWRFRGVKVSPNTVGKTLRAAQIPPVPPRHKKRRIKKKPKVQRFERALPMQLWQTDITSLMLTRHSQRVYLTVFLDDYSRYVVSWTLGLQQTKEFVMETLLAGISRFGKPEEVLTDQGRQYFSWRGKSDFRKLLKKQGIRHVVSRAHHPETVGKCERFWETVKAEFWDRVEPQELTDARERFDHFVKHYNHFRPHQGLDGLTPADRFFGAATEIRKMIEETISKNELRLAIGEVPRKPVFLIGQIGDTPVSLHGEKGQLVLQTADGLTKRLDYEDFGHAKKESTTPNAVEQKKGTNHDEARNEARKGNDQGPAPEKAQCEVRNAAHSGASGASTLGDGESRATDQGARSVSRAHGVLAGENHEAADGGATQDQAASDLAAVAASDFRYGGRAFDPTQDATTARSQEHGPTDTQRSGERSTSLEKEDRGARKDGLDAGEADLCFTRDAGLPRCEDPDGDARREGDSGGDKAQCSKTIDPENEGSNTDGSSS